MIFSFYESEILEMFKRDTKEQTLTDMYTTMEYLKSENDTEMESLLLETSEKLKTLSDSEFNSL